MRLGLLGNVQTPVSTESYVALALETLGHKVYRVQENQAPYGTLAQDLEDQECGIVFWVRTPHYRVDVADQARFLADADARGIVTCGLHLDKYFGLQREADVYSHPWFKQTHVMTADGGSQDKFEAAGVNHHWWRPAVSATQCGPGQFTDEYAADVAFVGSEKYHPEWPWRQVLLRRLPKMYGRRFRQYGRSGERLEDHQLADAYASIKVVVGDSCLAGNASRYFSNRIPETLGRGGFLVHPEVGGIDDYYRDGEQLVTYPAGNLNRLQEVVDQWLEDDEGRARIAAAGMARVVESETFECRMAEVLAHLIDAHPHLRPYRDILEAHARPDSTDRIVIREQFDEDTYRIADSPLRGRTVVDVGANIGSFALHAAERGAHVIAIEPEPGNAAVLCAVAIEAEADVTVLDFAVTGEEGTGSMHGDSGAAQFTAGPGEVRSFPLDWFLECHDDIAILKIDTEGSEYEIVAASKLLDRCERIEIEWHVFPGDDQTRIGALMTKLLETHTIEAVGLPSVGGALHCVRR